MSARRIIARTVKVAGIWLVGGAAAITVLILIVLAPILVELVVAAFISSYGIVRVAVSVLLALLTAWLFRLTLGSLLLAFIATAGISAIVGGVVGALLGSLSAAAILRRLSSTEVD